MIKFQIIIDKKGFEKKLKTTKGILGRMSSSLALIFSVIVLSTIIGLGIHLVLAYTNPTTNPAGGNIPGPVNVSTIPQTKEGALEVLNVAQKDAKWSLKETGNIYGYGNAAWFDNELWGKVVIGRELVYADDRLEAGNKIYAPNQNREHTQSCLSSVSGDCQYSTPNASMIECPQGKFLYKVQINKDGVSSNGWCAAPFLKTTSIPSVGGGGDEKVRHTEDAALVGYGETFDWMSPFYWTWSAY